MFGIGSGELIVLALIGIVVLGPERLVRLVRRLRSKLNDLHKEWKNVANP